MSKSVLWRLCIVQLLIGCSALFAQVGTQGSLLGTVLDAVGRGCPAADVTEGPTSVPGSNQDC